jgi:hypothetical protein
MKERYMTITRNAGLLSLCLAGCALTLGCDKPAAPASPSSGERPGGGASPKQAPAAAFKVNAADLAKEFIADPKAALEKYNGKVIEVEGTVAYANKIINNDRGFLLTGAKKNPNDIVGLNISCETVPAQQDKMWWLGQGQKVKVVGEVFNANNFHVSLKDCQFTELEKSPTPSVSAKELAEAFTKDEAAAKEKYRSKDGPNEIIVTGVVAGLEEKGGFSSVKLEGAGPVVVSCTVNKKDYDAVKKGDKVTMKGDLSIFDKTDHTITVNTAFLLKKD